MDVWKSTSSCVAVALHTGLFTVDVVFDFCFVLRCSSQNRGLFVLVQLFSNVWIPFIEPSSKDSFRTGQVLLCCQHCSILLLCINSLQLYLLSLLHVTLFWLLFENMLKEVSHTIEHPCISMMLLFTGILQYEQAMNTLLCPNHIHLLLWMGSLWHLIC